MRLVFLVGDGRIFGKPLARKSGAPAAVAVPVLQDAAIVDGASLRTRILQPPDFALNGLATRALQREPRTLRAACAAGRKGIHGDTSLF